MDNIYNFLKSVWLEIKEGSKNNFSFFFAILFVISIPLSLGINNFFLITFLISVIFERRIKTVFSKTVFYPILLFLLMFLSYSWSIDKSETLKAISTMLVLLVLPLSFLLFDNFDKNQIEKIKKYYSYSIVLYVIFFLTRAIIRYIITNDSRVLFYHGDYNEDYGLVPKSLNAIHVSIFVSIGYFYFLNKEFKSKMDKVILATLCIFIILLSSKNIILIFVLLNTIYFFFYSKEANKMRIRNLILLLITIVITIFFGKIKERFEIEFQTNSNKSISHNVINGLPKGVHNVSIIEAIEKDKFSPNDFFPGTAFRVYQYRMFLEIMAENNVFWTGLGFNASQKKLEEKGQEYNVFLGNEKLDGYQKKNFHNQYIQTFAELGFIGFLILLLLLIITIKNGVKNKDFLHIAFAILMISLFLTESFLSRQRGVVFFTFFYCLFNLCKTVSVTNKK